MIVMSQTAFPIVGGDVKNDRGSLSYTVGQVETHYAKARVTNAETSSSSFYEGVQQTYRINELGIVNADVIVAQVYPNPTTDRIIVQMLSDPKPYMYDLYTIDGILLLHSKMQEETIIDMSLYASGTYLLRLYGNGSESKYRIVKIR